MKRLQTIALWLTMAAAGSILISIAFAQILLALALGFLLLSGLPLKWPRISIPLGLFLIWTLLALAASPDPGFGMAQVRKMYVFLTLLVVYSVIKDLRKARWLTYMWMGVGTFTAGKGLLQLLRDIAGAAAAHEDFYNFYIADRIRGFMSHWMTFSGQELFVLLLLAAFVLFGPKDKYRLWIWLPCAAVVAVALVASNTRGTWIAAIVAGTYLLWQWRRWSALAMPVLIVLVLLAGPAWIRERADSLRHPHGATDSNEHRKIVWGTGWEMIKVHPLLGIGPDMTRRPSVRNPYLPKWVALPLPDGFYEHAHNIYIQYAAERGIPATLFIVAAMVLAVYDFLLALRRLPAGRSTERYLLQASIAFVIGAAVNGVFEYNLNDSEVLTMFLTMMCLGYTASKAQAKSPTLHQSVDG